VALPAGRVLPMSSPLFAVLAANHMGHDVAVPQVYDAIGRPELATDPIWGNTCAIRMSIALIGAGVKIRPGRLKIKAGRFKGELVEPGQRQLSEFLVREIGRPERYQSGSDARTSIASRRGIVSFFQLSAIYRGGHIDLASIENWGRLQCSGSCYWESREVWFWPLR
jgi:hypothetical protein